MRREVTSVQRDKDRDIMGLCGAWGVSSKAESKADIDKEPGAYHVAEIDIVVVKSEAVTDGFYLRSGPDGSEENNLEHLDECTTC